MIKKIGSFFAAAILTVLTLVSPVAMPAAHAFTCTPTYVIAVPGTWESSANDNPYYPTANRSSFMRTITTPLANSVGNRATIYTLPYAAQFKRAVDENQLSYDQSRQQGTDRLNNLLRDVSQQCPGTQFIIMGFSQGAVIAGDVANQIGLGSGTVAQDRIKGVILVADGRRDPTAGQFVGNAVGGVGAEVSLARINPLLPHLGLISTIDPSLGVYVAQAQSLVSGISIRGPRPGGFGSLNDRTFEICAPNDPVCDMPWLLFDAIQRANNNLFESIAHTQYATNPNVIPGTTAKDWIIDWVRTRV